MIAFFGFGIKHDGKTPKHIDPRRNFASGFATL